MKKLQREFWLVLNSVPLPDGVFPSLCTWCRHASWSGSCGEVEMDCEHPLEVVNEKSDDVSGEGYDCWGFRPDIAPEDAADVVGIWLRGQRPAWASVPRLGRQRGARV